MIKKQVLAMFFMVVCMVSFSFPVVAATQPQAKQSSVLTENDAIAAQNNRYRLQFVDSTGKPVPYLYVYWDKHPNYGDNTLPTGFPTDQSGVWEPPYDLADENGVYPSRKTIVVKNLFGRLYQFEQSYTLDFSANQSTPTQLVWTKETPMRSLASNKHRLIIRVQDEKGQAIEGAKIELREPNFDWQYGFHFYGFTDSKGNYYTNLHDDITYTVSIRCPDPKLTVIDREFQLDATKGGTISKTFIIKDRNKEFIRYS